MSNFFILVQSRFIQTQWADELQVNLSLLEHIYQILMYQQNNSRALLGIMEWNVEYKWYSYFRSILCFILLIFFLSNHYSIFHGNSHSFYLSKEWTFHSILIFYVIKITLFLFYNRYHILVYFYTTLIWNNFF